MDGGNVSNLTPTALLIYVPAGEEARREGTVPPGTESWLLVKPLFLVPNHCLPVSESPLLALKKMGQLLSACA